MCVAQTPLRAERVYVGEGVTLTGVGACSESPEKIQCWDMDGVDAPDLAEILAAHYLVQPYSTMNHRFGKKNRLLVVRSEGQASRSAQLRYEQGRTAQFTMNDSNVTTEFIRTADPSDATSAEVSYTIRDSQLATSEVLKLEKGASVSFGGTTLTYQSIKKRPPMGGGYTGFNSYANQTMYRTTLTRPARTSLSFDMLQALDKDSAPIVAIDAKGRPIPTGSSSPNYVRVEYGGESMDGREVYIDTNVDPSHVKFLRLGQFKSTQVVLTGFPLDPKVNP